MEPKQKHNVQKTSTEDPQAVKVVSETLLGVQAEGGFHYFIQLAVSDSSHG